MALYHILIFALIQGITEFLPVSSSGHLVLGSIFLDLPDQGIAVNVAVHIGTLLAVIIYFYRDLLQITSGFFKSMFGRRGGQTKILLNLIIATLPIVVAGYFLFDLIGTILHDIEAIAWATIGFAILLWIADKLGMTLRRLEHIGPLTAFLIGLAQVLAFIPGASRSGVTITAARFLGIERPDAIRFSMLLSIPTILGAGILTFLKLENTPTVLLQQDVLIAAGLAFIAGLVSISFLMSLVKKTGFGIFVIYRILLGCALIFWIYI